MNFLPEKKIFSKTPCSIYHMNIFFFRFVNITINIWRYDLCINITIFNGKAKITMEPVIVKWLTLP